MTDDLQDSPDDVGDSPVAGERSSHGCFFAICAAPIIMVLLIALLSPSVRRSLEPARRTQCRNNLRQIAIAIHLYHDTYGAFPPAYTVDADGKPLHSWRTLILPYLDQQPLYNQIDLSKPWDDPANSEAYQTEIDIFRCPSAVSEPNQTTYLAVVTPDSCIRPTEPTSLEEVTDGASETLLAIEVAAEHAVHWMTPVDADEQIVLGFGTETEVSHQGGTHVLMVDASVVFLSGSTEASVRRAMISAAGDD